MFKRAEQNLLVYGLASLADGLVMTLSLGLIHASMRTECALWMARRSALKRDVQQRADFEAQPRNWLKAGIYRNRQGRTVEVTPNLDNRMDGLPWLVDDTYTVDDSGFIYPHNGRAYPDDVVPHDRV